MSKQLCKKLLNFLQDSDETCLNFAENSLIRTKMNGICHIGDILEDIVYDDTEYSCTAYHYGSRVYGTSVSSSDLDFYLDIEGGIEDEYEAAEILRQIKKALLNYYDWEVCVFLPEHRVPLLSVIYTPMDLKCDIVVTNGSCVYVCQMLKHLNLIQPEILTLFHFIRIWLEINQVRIKGYIQYLLLLFYLQGNNYMPTIERIQRNLEPIFMDGKQVQFNKNYNLCSYGTKKIRNYKDHVVGYFNFYGSYNFEAIFPSVYLGKSYYRYGSGIGALYIEGPLDRGELDSKMPVRQTLDKFQRVCNFSVEFLEDLGWN